MCKRGPHYTVPLTKTLIHRFVQTPKHSLIAARWQPIMNDTVVAGLVSGDPDEDDDEDYDDGEDWECLIIHSSSYKYPYKWSLLMYYLLLI